MRAIFVTIAIFLTIGRGFATDAHVKHDLLPIIQGMAEIITEDFKSKIAEEIPDAFQTQRANKAFSLLTSKLCRLLALEAFEPPAFDRILKAIQFAFRKHKDHIHRASPLRVAYQLIVLAPVKDPDIIIAALLNSTVTKTETTVEEIEDLFGRDVANLVREVTVEKRAPKEIRKELQIFHAQEKSKAATLIILASKLDKLRDLRTIPPKEWSIQRRDEYFLWAQQVVENLPYIENRLGHEVDQQIEKYWSSQSSK